MIWRDIFTERGNYDEKTCSNTGYCICGLFCRVPASKAELVIIGFTAEVTFFYDSSGLLEGRIGIGDTMTGTYIYDTSTPDLSPAHPGIATYEHTCSACGISVEVGGFEFKTDPDNVEFVVSIEDDIADLSGYAKDSFELKSENNLPVYDGLTIHIPFYNSVTVRWLYISLIGTTEAISSDVLPTTAPVLDDWNSENIMLELMKRGIVIRSYQTPYMKNHLRITIRSPDQNDKLLNTLKEIIHKS